MKSNVSDYLELARCIYIDACAKCPADVSDLRDLKTIRSRVEHEGLSFLTITLPNFCQGLEKALKFGYIDPSWFRGFPFHGSIPAFLQGMIGHVFNHETGRIYDDETSTSVGYHPIFIDSIRQICLAFKKVELDCTPERVQAAIANFVEIEHSFNSFKATEEECSEFLAVSSVLWHDCILRLRDDMLRPKHGPGATAERISGNRKYAWRYWFKRLDNYFPLFDHAYISSAVDSEEVELVTFVDPEHELPVRVTPVPKTLKGPRIIAIEPCCMQYAQQGIRGMLYSAIESSWYARGHVNFRDQGVNQTLAMSASSTGLLATIDLSDASDRVPRDLALEMFRSYPEIMGAIDACRSTRAELPDGQIIGPLSKFASMGSALCFPVESMYFYTICVMALLQKHHLPVTPRNCFSVSRSIYVYGDDIIVPTYAAEIVLDYLQKYNCKVNTSKSFWSGSFRESCGVDAYAGVAVNPVYIRQERPKNKRHAAQLISWSASANLFALKGYYRTAEFMHNVCESILGFYPRVSETSQALGRIYRDGERKSPKRTSPRFQRLEVKGWIPSAVFRTDRLGGYAALQKSLLKLDRRKAESSDVDSLLDKAKLDFHSFESPDDPYHLERSALYGAVTLKLRWVAPT